MAKTPAKKTAAKKTAKKEVKKAAPKKAAAKTTGKATAPKTAAKKAAPKKVAVKSVVKKGVRPTRNKAHQSSDDALALALTVAQGMFEKKAEDIRILDMREIPGASADFFVISHASSDKQVEAIADSAEDEARKVLNERPWHREGFENLEWVLLDYIDVVAHVFQQEKREFYGVEELWGDATEVPFKGK